MHEDGAFGVAHAVLADGAEQHSDELAMSAAPDDEQIRTLRSFDKGGRWVPIDHSPFHAIPGKVTRVESIAVSSVLRTSASGSNSSGTGTAQPKLDGHSHVMTTSSTLPVRSAWRAAHESAANDASEPSMPDDDPAGAWCAIGCHS